MNIKRVFQPVVHSHASSTAILILRLIAGLGFVLHGWQKMQAPMSWMPAGAPVPGVFQFLAAFAEFGGGIAWILGLLMPLASLGIFITMTVATLFMIMSGASFVSYTGGPAFEPPLVYWGIALVFMIVGAGKFSADAKIFGERLN